MFVFVHLCMQHKHTMNNGIEQMFLEICNDSLNIMHLYLRAAKIHS